MSRDINLAGKIEEVGFPHEKVVLLRKIALASASVTIIIALLVFFVSLQFSLSSAQADQAKVSAQLAAYQKKINEARLLKDRLNQIRNISVGRDERYSKVDKIVSKKPQGVDIDSINLEEKSIVISFKANSLSEINTLVSSLEEIKSTQPEKIRISELKLVPGQGYILSITIE